MPGISPIRKLSFGTRSPAPLFPWSLGPCISCQASEPPKSTPSPSFHGKYIPPKQCGSFRRFAYTYLSSGNHDAEHADGPERTAPGLLLFGASPRNRP